MSRSRRPFGLPLIPSSLLIAGMLLVAAPAWGYIVFLKDGSQITTKEKYRIEGDRAILVLPSGTTAFYQASEIDIEKTAKVNEVELGNARIIEGLDKPRRVPKKPQPADEDPSFGEYISGRSLALPELKKRQAADKPQRGELPTTQAGFVDLQALRRVPYPNTEITSQVLGYLKGQGVDRVRIFQGTRSDRPLLEVVAASEASVFKAITDSAQGLAQIHERFPDQVGAFELVLMNDSQQRAGQFLLTPERADMLVSGSLTVSQFFLRYVEF
ncbi:MAG: hypothetical protein GY719_07570 [bacterium]|nr:hypothetical protein [bacterium]